MALIRITGARGFIEPPLSAMKKQVRSCLSEMKSLATKILSRLGVANKTEAAPNPGATEFAVNNCAP
ncbi:MAG: hypothetical protein KJ787_14970 [Gammaproteobacteria bacterium]|nr:hypothetical protein [Gammaproteobacteria bacterium]